MGRYAARLQTRNKALLPYLILSILEIKIYDNLKKQHRKTGLWTTDPEQCPSGS